MSATVRISEVMDQMILDYLKSCCDKYHYCYTTLSGLVKEVDFNPSDSTLRLVGLPGASHQITGYVTCNIEIDDGIADVQKRIHIPLLNILAFVYNKA